MQSAAAWRPYLAAVLLSAAAVAFTRYTWPLLASAPFVAAFGMVAIVSQWGSGGAGLLTVALSALGLAAAFRAGPGVPPFGWHTPPLFLYVLVGAVGSRLIDARRQAVIKLRASETELRATLVQMRTSEEQLRRAQKMEAVGQLAAGVAHNFNNLLQVTMGYIDVLGDVQGASEFDQSAIAEIRKATQRGAALTRQLMAFSRRHEPHAVRLDLDVTLSSLRDMLSRVVREDIELRFALEAGGTVVMLDPSDLEQVLINLVINARDALPSGGAIQVDSAVVTLDAASAPAGQNVTPGRYARFRVIDNGTGMGPDVQAHLFEPFFTTKEVGQGTGLGLAFVHGVAQHGGGFTAFETAPGKGTTIAVYLPVAAAAAEPAAAPAPAAAFQAAHGATILLVEDEGGVRKTTDRILSRAGYRVLAAANAAEASALFDVHAQSIDLLLTDVVMPGMHGPELAARLAASRPDLPVVFVSGHSDEMPALHVVSSRAAFVPKPFSASHLVQTVEGLLAADRT
jgi:two-component system, cell cycle sensor histidine kinase and response regulator CckA